MTTYSIDVSNRAPDHGLETDIGSLVHHVNHVWSQTSAVNAIKLFSLVIFTQAK